VNAAEQAKGFEVASKIAAIVNLFKAEFPDAKADLKPWRSDPDTQELVDPDSIDIGFHLPGWSRRIQSRSILVQIRFYQDPLEDTYRLIGLEMAGFNHSGQAWRFSTVEQWQFVGNTPPTLEVQEQIKHFARQVFDLFSG
jgi:hypothetical protein